MRSQLYAFEKYIAKLAEELTGKQLPNMSTVSSIFYIQSHSTFPVAKQ